MRLPATDADTVPGLAMKSLLSAGKVTDANNIAIFTKTKVNIFDAETTPVKADKQAILSGWWCPQTKLHGVPLKRTMSNLNTDTTLLSTGATDIIMNKRKHLPTTKFANSIYELPNTEQHGTMHQQDTRPKQRGKKPPRNQKQSNVTSLNPPKQQRATCAASNPASDPPRPIQEAEHNLAQQRKKHKDIYMSIRDTTELAYTDQTG
eukprot:CCRYP_007090-RA/>CCRYP_007090-RA protein AED:0.37 eAED:0.37 QI:0/0/0/1/0/0/2/0/205